MYDVRDINEAPAAMQPAEKEPSQLEKLVGQVLLSGFLLATIFALFYLSVILSRGQSGQCTYSGDIPIHPDFVETYQSHCLVIGPPISNVATQSVDGIDGLRKIQYFEGALLLSPPAGSSITPEIYPLGAHEFGSIESTNTVAVSQLNNLPEDALANVLLGNALGGTFETDNQLHIYYEYGSLVWDLESGRFTRQSLGRDHALEHAPELLVEGELTRVIIPRDSIRFFLDTLSIANNSQQPSPEYVMDVTVKHPILFPENQQIVTVEVYDRVSNEPISGLQIAGIVYFEAYGNSATDVIFEPTNTAGTYAAQIEMPTHPEGNAGREVLIDVFFESTSSERITGVKSFQTWW